MKRILRSSFAAGLLLTAGWAGAQSVNTSLSMKADIPFAFNVGHTTLPAGRYTVRSFGASDGKTLLIQSSDGKSVTSIRTHGVESSSGAQVSKLRFLALGEKHFLWEIWTVGNPSGYQLPKNPEAVELELARRAETVDLLAEQRH